MLDLPPDTRLPDLAARAADRLAALQASDGSWEGEVVWCPVITAQAVIVWTITGSKISASRRSGVLRHFEATQCEDGGWGLHPQSEPYRFVTTLVYVAARLLGEAPEAPMLVAARQFLGVGGIWSLPQWGKVWLSFIGLYDPRGINPCPPELFLLPRWVAFSPLRFYCHTRHIYLGMAYLIGMGFHADIRSIAPSLRQELYGDDADDIDAAARRHELADTDAYVRPGRLLRLAYDAAHHAGKIWRRLPGAGKLRRRALDACLRRIRFEQRATRFQGLSPVNGLLNVLALYSREPSGSDTLASLAGIEAWRWEDAAGGIRYAGARSTTWDTSFALQALVASHRLAPVHAISVQRAHRRLLDMQLTEELSGCDGQHRDSIRGGWCFSDGAHRWPVSDCTAEALIAILDCEELPGVIAPKLRLPAERLSQAVAFMLSRQNADGGFATYERRRGQSFLERINPSEMFGQCMTELSYLECTASSVRALCRARGAERPADRSAIDCAIERGVALILARQRADGSWPGFWGINFVYGTLFAVEALRDAGYSPAHPALLRAREWLYSIQREDGGWGEHFSGCLSGKYVANDGSLVITTAWALLALLSAEAEPSGATQRGAAWLCRYQQQDGDWPRDGVNGVFFGTAMLDYRLYNTYFPAMALARYAAHRL